MKKRKPVHEQEGSPDVAATDSDEPDTRDQFASYNERKWFEGKAYTGMRVGGRHSWNYEAGEWNETKIEPDKWEFDYKVTKRRKRRAPKGSGALVGTEYHWFVVAHQYVKKTDANTYTTHMHGLKYKLAHKWASSEAWNIETESGQRDKEVEILRDAMERAAGRKVAPGGEGKRSKKSKLDKGQRTLDAMFGGGTKGKVEIGDRVEGSQEDKAFSGKESGDEGEDGAWTD